MVVCVDRKAEGEETSENMLAVRLPRISVSTGASTRLFSSDRVKIVEVGPRDGLQNEPLQVSVDDKVELIRRLEHAGCRHIETASFVSPKWVPSMANSLEVLKDLKRHQPPGVIYLTLVPNVRGMEQAIAGEADEIAIFGSASESFSQKVRSYDRIAVVRQGLIRCRTLDAALRSHWIAFERSWTWPRNTAFRFAPT